MNVINETIRYSEVENEWFIDKTSIFIDFPLDLMRSIFFLRR